MSASALHRAPCRCPGPPDGPPGALLAAAARERRPDTHASRECVQCRSCEFPDARVGLGPALLDRLGRDRRRLPVLLGQQVQAGGRGEQLQRLAQPVQLELAGHPVAGPGRPARVPGQPQRAFTGKGLARHRVGGHETGAVGEEAFGDEADGALQERVRAVRRDGQARVALVADPGVPVVVVPAAFQVLGKRRGGGRDHRAAARRQPAQDGVGVAGVARGGEVVARGHHGGPGFLGGGPGPVRVGRLAVERPVGKLEDEVVMAPGGEGHGEGEPVVAGPRAGRARPAEPQAAAAAGPASAGPGQVRHRAAPEPGADIEDHVHPGRPVDGHDAPQDHGAMRIGRHGQGLPAFGSRFGSRRAHPAAPPDQGPGLVVAAPDVPGIGGRDRVGAAAAEQSAEDRRAVPPRRAQPRDRPVGADQGAALPVGDQRVLTQDVRAERSGHGRAPVRQRPAETPGPRV